MMEAKLKHLEFIQGVISRMARNSFMLKGWSVLLVSALFALAAAGSNQAFIFLAFLPAIAFWLLDGYFLRQEQLFRKLYDKVRLLNDSDIDFSMDTSCVKDQVAPWSKVVSSDTLELFHIPVIGTIFVVIVISIILDFIK